MILLKSSANHDWPWSGAGEDAEGIFRSCYPSVYDHIKPYEEQLEGREDKGRFWWELRSCSYYDVFDKPKVLWQDLGYHSKFCFSSTTTIPEATCFSLATDDLWLLAVLNSPLMWVYLWRHTIHGKDEVLRLKTLYMEKLPIVNAGAKEDSVSRSAVSRLIQIASLLQSTSGDILDWLRVQHEIADPNTRLQDPIALDSDAFVAEAQKARGKKNPLTAAGLRSLRDEYVPHDRASTVAGGRGTAIGIPPPRPGQRRLRPDHGGSPANVGHGTAADADHSASAPLRRKRNRDAHAFRALTPSCRIICVRAFFGEKTSDTNNPS